MAKFTNINIKRLEEITARAITITPFSDDTSILKAERKKTIDKGSWESFAFFCKTYFPHICELNFADYHKEMFEITEKNKNSLTAITGFRGLAKTVLMSPLYSIFKIIHGVQFVINVSADEDLAIARNSIIFNELKNNQRILNDFPKLAILEGVEEEFLLKNKARIKARSIKQAIRGLINPTTAKRPDLIVCDDIDKLDNVGNMGIGKTKLEKITNEILGALNPKGDGRVLWLGNLTHPNFAICQFENLLIENIKSNNPTARISQRKHLFCDELILCRFPLEIIRNGQVVSAWEEQYPTSELPALRQKFGYTGYLREFLGHAVIEGNIFKHYWFKKWTILPKKMKRVWMYADPAWGQKGCYKAIIAIGFDGFSFYVLKVWVRQTENSKFFRYYYDAFTELNKKYKSLFRASIETNYGQDRILADFDNWAKDNNLTPISYLIKRINNRENKNLRIERLETAIETSKILFPDGQDTPILINQFLTYPQGYIDGCDALAGCMERFGEYSVTGSRIRIRSVFRG